MTTTFDFIYKKVFTQKVEFRTNVFQSFSGKEQRVNKTAYPIKTFVLEFDKDWDTWLQIENFIKNLKGRNSQFLWTPIPKYADPLILDETPLEQGVLSYETYLCRLSDDNFRNNKKRLGYSEFSLSFDTIDTNPLSCSRFNFQDNSSFDFSYEKEYEYSLEHKTIIDNNIVANMFVQSAFSSPRRKWKLKLSKNNSEKQDIINFFISKRGKCRSFDFKWKSEYGGDDNTYRVRFNNDILEILDFRKSYGKIELELLEVL